MPDLVFPGLNDELLPPPAYEFSQQEFDQKVTAATERSIVQDEQEQERRQQESWTEEQWEEWDDNAFQANVARHADPSGQSSSSSMPVEEGRSAKECEAFGGQDPYYYSGQNGSGSQSVRPLSIQKKPLDGTANPPQKERPSWYDEAQLGQNGGGSSSGSSQPVPQVAPQAQRRSLPVPAEQQAQLAQHVIPEDQEDDRSAPPPPFAPIDNSLDGPAYERYATEQQQRRLSNSTASTVVLRYAGEDLAASPPPSPPMSPIVPSHVEPLNFRQRATSPRINANPTMYQPQMQYHTPQAIRKQSRPAMRPTGPSPPITKQQYVPPPPRMDFDPSVAYQSTKSMFGQLPMDTLKRGEGAASLYNSAVAAHMTPSASRQPVAPPAKRYTGSIINADVYGNTQQYQQPQQNIQPSQQFYGVQDFASSRASFYPQTSMNQNPQYSQATQYQQVPRYPVQQGYPERPMSTVSSVSSISQGDQLRWSASEPQYQQQYYQR